MAELLPGDFLAWMAEQIYCYIDGDKNCAPWTLTADRNVDREEGE